jgi:hypothetical protein
MTISDLGTRTREQIEHAQDERQRRLDQHQSLVEHHRDRLMKKAVELVLCPVCEAKPGEPCQTVRDAFPYQGYVHGRRRNVIWRIYVMGLSDGMNAARLDLSLTSFMED